MTSLQYEECNSAIKRIVPQISMEKVRKIILETPFISDLQKEFYTTMLFNRKERILNYTLNQLSRGTILATDVIGQRESVLKKIEGNQRKIGGRTNVEGKSEKKSKDQQKHI